MATRPAILGGARLNNVRLAYEPADLAAVRLVKITVLLAGVRAQARIAGITIQDVLNDAPNTCSLTIDNANPPTVAQVLRVTCGIDAPILLFAGTLQTVDESYEGLAGQKVWPCTAIDFTFRLNRRRPFGTFVSVSATTIAQTLAAAYAPTFGVSHIAAGLPTVSIIFDGSTDFIGCLAQLATAIGGYCKVDDLDIYLFLADTASPPDAIDTTPGRVLDSPPISVSIDVSQLRTRVFGKGHGETVLADILAGETIIPLADSVMFTPTGGKALAGTTSDGAQSQQIAYTGIRLAAGGSLVGPGAAPAVGPAVARVVSAGNLGSGVYGYAIVDVTALGKSLPGPVTQVTTGSLTGLPIADPTFALAVALGAGAGIEDGVHGYAYTWVSASGETLPTALTNVTHGPTQASPTTIGTTIVNPAGTGPLTINSAFAYAYTFKRNSDGVETTRSPGGGFNSSSRGQNGQVALAGCQSAPAGWTRTWYRTKASGVTYFLIPGAFWMESGGNFNENASDAQLSATVAPTANGTAQNQSAVSAVAVGPAGITARNIYRTVAGGAQLKLLHQLADNTTTTWADTAADATLGANAPTVNTTAVTTVANQTAVTGIAVGASPTLYRELYRTTVNGSQLKLLFTVADNITTGTYFDNTADGGLGANAPIADTSGLAFAGGQVNAGSVTLPTASAAPFAASGWVILSGGQAVRYTGVSGNSLTGIPATGPGAILTTVLFGSQALPAPSLTGVTGLALAMLKGAPVSIWVQRDDLTAQAAQAAVDATNGITPADGIYEGPVIADERRGEASLAALCDATLQLYSKPIATFTYATRDLKTRSGKTVHINLPGYPVGDYVIQQATITELGSSPALAPRFTVTASTVRFSLDDLLRKLVTGQGG